VTGPTVLFSPDLIPADMFTVKPNVAVSILTIALTYCTSVYAQTSRAADPEWALKPAISLLPNWYEVRGGTWRVSKDIVEDMASRIKGELGSAYAEPNRYVIQYRGGSSGDSRSIRLSGACDTQGTNEREFSEKFFIVYDGGKCFFDATYDLKEKRFSYFAYHNR
jgi:hypothetical protein